MITSLSELYFRIRRFILLVQMKKVISMNYDNSTSSWKPWRWVRFDLIFSMRDIYINSNLNPLTKFTSSSSRSTEFKPMEHLSNNHKDRPNQNENIHKLCNETSMETDKTTWSEFPNGGKAFAEKIIASEQRNKSKRAGLWESQSGIRIGKLTIWARSFEISSTRIGEPVLMMDLNVSKDKNISRWVDR